MENYAEKPRARPVGATPPEKNHGLDPWGWYPRKKKQGLDPHKKKPRRNDRTIHHPLITVVKRGGRAQRGAHAFVLGSKGDNSLAADKGFFLHFVYQHMLLDSKYLI